MRVLMMRLIRISIGTLATCVVAMSTCSAAGTSSDLRATQDRFAERPPVSTWRTGLSCSLTPTLQLGRSLSSVCIKEETRIQMRRSSGHT